MSVNPTALPQTQLNTSRERPPDLLSDHTITANDAAVYRGHAAVAAGVSSSGGSSSKPGSEHSSAAGSYRMAMENIIDEYSRCRIIAQYIEQIFIVTCNSSNVAADIVHNAPNSGTRIRRRPPRLQTATP